MKKENHFEGLYKAKLRDNGIEYNEDDYKQFCKQISKDFSKGLLDLSGQRIGINILTKLTKVLRANPHIRSFNFYGNLIRDHGIHSLYQLLLVNPQVTVLDIGCNDLSNQASSAILDIIRNTSVESLQLGTTGIAWHNNKFSVPTLVDILNTIFQTNRIKCLGLTGLTMSVKVGARRVTMCTELARFVENDTKCSTLAIAETGFPAKELAEVLDGLLTNDRIRHLDLHGNMIVDPYGPRFLGDLNGMTQLSYLDLHNCHLSQDAGYQLGESLKAPNNIAFLDISDNEIMDEGFLNIVDALLINDTLTELNVSNNYITDRSSDIICELIRHNEILYFLDLSKNAIGDEGAETISTALTENQNLVKLFLSKCRISDVGAINIAKAMKHNKSLRHLKMSDNFLTRECGYSILDHIRANETIFSIDLSATQIDHFVLKAVRDICKRNQQIQREIDLQPLKKQIVQLSIQRTKMPEAISRLKSLNETREQLEQDVEDAKLNIDETIAYGDRTVGDLLKAIATAHEMTADEEKATLKNEEERQKMIISYDVAYKDIIASTEKERALTDHFIAETARLEKEMEEYRVEYVKEEEEVEKKIAEFQKILDETMAQREDPELVKVYVPPHVDYGTKENDPVFLVDKIDELKALERGKKKRKRSKSPKKSKKSPKKSGAESALNTGRSASAKKEKKPSIATPRKPSVKKIKK